MTPHWLVLYLFYLVFDSYVSQSVSSECLKIAPKRAANYSI